MLSQSLLQAVTKHPLQTQVTQMDKDRGRGRRMEEWELAISNTITNHKRHNPTV